MVEDFDLARVDPTGIDTSRGCSRSLCGVGGRCVCCCLFSCLAYQRQTVSMPDQYSSRSSDRPSSRPGRRRVSSFQEQPHGCCDDGQRRGHHECLKSPEPLVDVVQLVLERLIANCTFTLVCFELGTDVSISSGLRVVGYPSGLTFVCHASRPFSVMILDLGCRRAVSSVECAARGSSFVSYDLFRLFSRCNVTPADKNDWCVVAGL